MANLSRNASEGVENISVLDLFAQDRYVQKYVAKLAQEHDIWAIRDLMKYSTKELFQIAPTTQKNRKIINSRLEALGVRL